jgi:hypothetical protein
MRKVVAWVDHKLAYIECNNYIDKIVAYIEYYYDIDKLRPIGSELGVVRFGDRISNRS